MLSGCSLEGMMVKLKFRYFGHLMRRVDSLEKTDAGKDWGQEEKGATEDEIAGWHHQLDGCEFEWTPEDGDGQGGLVCCSSWGHKESDTTERLNWTELNIWYKDFYTCENLSPIDPSKSSWIFETCFVAQNMIYPTKCSMCAWEECVFYCYFVEYSVYVC